MKMSAWLACWLVFLALFKNISDASTIYFQLEDQKLTAKEGSSVDIKCTVTARVLDSQWFWIMNHTWTDGKLEGTVIYSSNAEKHPVNEAFAGRVNYTGSKSSTWSYSSNYSPKLCSISISNLKKSDSGTYAFRYLGYPRWKTAPDLILTVIDNPCLITFEKPPAVKAPDTVTLTCSTPSSCSSEPEIGGLAQVHPYRTSRPPQTDRKTVTASFTANWQDDGKEFSCQTKDNDDQHLIRKISVTAEYPPQGLSAKKSPEDIVEGNFVTLTCTAKGRPDPTFTWFKNGNEVGGQKAELKIQSITESYNGDYHCEAANTHGKDRSNSVTIDVDYKPEVELTSPASEVKQGDKVTLTCHLNRAKPAPDHYAWSLNGTTIPGSQGQMNLHVIEEIQPEQRGQYRCSATNTVGTGTSPMRQIKVTYGPRKTNISINKDGKQVKVGDYLAFTCNTDANPAPHTYFWSRQFKKTSKQTSQRNFRTTPPQKKFYLGKVERGDEACYTCNATNNIGQGTDSEPLCIEVLYAPTKPMLSMSGERTEGQLITIRCSVESFPPSTLKLTRTPLSRPSSPNVLYNQPDYHQPPNNLHHAFNLTSDDTGVYTCNADNNLGSAMSNPVTLEVKYRPKRVTVTAEPFFVVKENKSLTLHCKAESNPQVKSVTWMKKGKSGIIWRKQEFTLKFVSPSDSGLYSCTATNEIGSGISKPAEVKVQYAPKVTKITRAAEQLQPDGTSSVKLSCSSESEPPVKQYSWYKVNSEGKDIKLNDQKDFTVYSYEPGSYYCVAKNDINERFSDPVHLFDRSWIIILLIALFVVILFIAAAIFVHRHRKKKNSAHRGTTSTTSCLGFPGGWNGSRMNRMNNPPTAEPFRSRDDLLPEQPRCPKARRCQPRPDSTPESNISCVYSTVNLPSRIQVPSAQKPIRQQGGHTQEDPLNYASLHFGNKQMNKRAKAVEDVYAIVSKEKPPKKNDGMQEDYENISAAKNRSPDPLNYDTDTSEDEAEINYSKVSFKAKTGHRRAHRNSSSSDDETQYSQVKI